MPREPIQGARGHDTGDDVVAHAPATAVPDDDAVLVERASAGDERAFTQLYRRHARYLAGVIYRLMGDDQDLEDVIQETFVDASDQLHGLRDGNVLRSWLTRIAVRKVHRKLARRRRRRMLGAEAPPAPTSTDPAHDQEVRALFRALERLSPKIRVPWVLHRVEGQTLPEVADACEVSLATVKRRIADAESRLNRRLHEE